MKLTEYGIQLKHPKMLVVNVGNDARPVWVPPELCITVPGQIPWGTVWRPENQNDSVCSCTARCECSRYLRLWAGYLWIQSR